MRGNSSLGEVSSGVCRAETQSLSLGGLVFWELLAFFAVPIDAMRLHLSSFCGTEVFFLVVDLAIGRRVAFSGEVERSARIVVENTVLVGGDALIDICHTPRGGSVPRDLGSAHFHFHFVMGTNALVAITEGFHVFELNADPFAVDVKPVVGRIFCSHVANNDVGTGDRDGAGAFLGRQNDPRLSRSFSGRPAEVERSLFREAGLSRFQLGGCDVAP